MKNGGVINMQTKDLNMGIDRYIGKMRAVNIYFDDKEFEMLEKQKDGKSWKQFILDLANNKYEEKDG